MENTIMPTPDAALEKLIEGNKRFINDSQIHPNQDSKRRTALRNGQSPFAAVLTCADSRVSPEVLFDQGLGDLFVVRVAGNIINDQLLGSLEYAAGHLHTSLIIVLSHTSCGAVGAVASGGELEGHIASLAPAIQPAINNVANQKGNLVDNAAQEVARMMADQLQNSQPVLADLVKEKKLKVVPAIYQLDTGEVKLL